MDADNEGVVARDDCDDGDASRFPGNVELCNLIDDDCAGFVDVESDEDTLWFADEDADGYGDSSIGFWSCEQPIGYVSGSDDCDDGAFAIHPGALEHAAPLRGG